ncbi:unnamed protein product, partial [Staurois parvus]
FFYTDCFFTHKGCKSNHFSFSLAAFLQPLRTDWSQFVTWYKAVVNSLVPCDLCDHSQISHVCHHGDTVLLVGGDEDFYSDCFYTHTGCKRNH